MSIWITSDTHFNHTNIIQYCGRPFANAELMDECLIDNWNSVVKTNDHVYHLGDVYMGGDRRYISEILHRLNGKKRLILGNHDNGQDQMLHRHFEKIMMWRCFEKVVLTHVPIHISNIPGDRINVHGHIHNNKSPDGPYRCVCVEQTNYTPINLEEINR